jgi:hypothetical protein
MGFQLAQHSTLAAALDVALGIARAAVPASAKKRATEVARQLGNAQSA